MTPMVETSGRERLSLLSVLTDEGLRLFFPLGALYAAAWPFLWVVVLGFDLPLARQVPATQWHPHEMLIGAYGAALIGFVTTAVPEWTDSEQPGPLLLWPLAVLWGVGRCVGVLGFDLLGALGALADGLWLGALLVYVGRVSWQRRTTSLSGFMFWLLVLLAAEVTTRIGFIGADTQLAARGLTALGLAFLGLLGLALARVAVPVTNLVLDPSETTSPYRPHPGRRNLAPGLVAIALAGEVAGASIEVRGYLCLAAGAAFLDRAGESFIGRPFMRAEILCLFGASALAGLGLLAVGASRLGAPLTESSGLHVALLGGLGLSVLAVFSIAGLMHTNHALRLPAAAKLAFLLLVAATALRVLPDLGVSLPGNQHVASAIAWALAFLVWLYGYWPLLADAGTVGRRSC
ncbi:MAG: NnrS family protein [Hyphomicrobiaceae bacterium]|nr:MAG: NnrS family protein [Hyphomicrobiaceae bacterium]